MPNTKDPRRPGPRTHDHPSELRHPSHEATSTMLPETFPESWHSARRRLRHALSFLAGRASEVTWVVAIYLVCELLIWGIYSALRPARIEFLSSIAGMVLVFVGVSVLGWIFPRTDSAYCTYVRSKVDFINQNLGIGFPVPMIMFTDKENFGDVGTIFGNFFGTGAVFWTSILLISWLVMLAILRTSAGRDHSNTDGESSPAKQKEESKPPSSLDMSRPLPIHSGRAWPRLAGTTPCDSAVASTATSITAVDLEHPPAPAPAPAAKGPSPLLRTWYSVLLAAACVLLVGIPASYAAGEGRPLDFSVLWLAWTASVRAQATLRRANVGCLRPGVLRDVLATSLNPVLLTTFSMAAYTRLKARAHDVPVDDVLRTFSSGTSFAQLWSGTAAAGTPSFGAGDAALSLLEVGIVVWGFKLYECRRQLASPAGVAVVLVSVLSAALSSFASVAMGRAMGVAARECLSFAARSTTLALAKPSTAALGGSEMVNACLVVGNGIAGQLLAPWLLGWLRVRDVSDGEGEGGGEGEGQGVGVGEGEAAGAEELDSAVEVAAGAVIGMNGAAMGVSYLYERRSRAAPYAALSMTAFGVVTTVLASVEPFRDGLKSVAGV